uniref:Zinc finger protein VAR3, chloroplastic-like n=1 Tax=Nicotiana tabacum TaxID=4097 RepID=A0A1S4D145_TOBAC|nr:PREDICTED: zinc finger protein VAR3, chloroplastic-like [Nicotiana tabacum]
MRQLFFGVNEEKAQRWFSKVSQMNNASDIDSAAADEDFPEIMPLRKGENKFVVSTRKTPLERRLANSQYNMNLGNNVIPEDMFDKKNQTSVMDEKVNEKVGIFHSPEASHQTSSASVGNDFGMSVEKLQSNRSFSKDKEREQAEKSASWFKKIAELHDVKDLPSAISDDDFPEIMPMRKGENRFVVSKKKDRSLTSPMYKRQVAMEQANNSSKEETMP